MKCTKRQWVAAACAMCAVWMTGAGSCVLAQEKTKGAAKPALAPVHDDPALPRVLIIGASISIGYTPHVQKALVGKANVHHNAGSAGSTVTGLRKIDSWLGDGRWDVIYFNWGLHDLKTVDGKRATPINEYEQNLRTLVARLKKTGATLIWCSSPPVPANVKSPPRSNDDVLAYNAVAKRVMEENGVAINDLYAFAMPQLKEIQLPENVHYTEKGYAVLASEVARCIRNTLESRKKAK